MEWWHLGLNMMVLWSFAPVLLNILGDRLTAHNSWPFYLTSAAFAAAVGLAVRKMRGVTVGSLGAVSYRTHSVFSPHFLLVSQGLCSRS